MKYVFVTGGVVSGLGKGITAASLGRLLKDRGFKVMSQKLDPYINLDPGLISPYEHGEVFVTEDGCETDLDLGHYERFTDTYISKFSSLTTGKVYWSVLNKERKGQYQGKTIQVIPHITNEIKNFIYEAGKQSGADVVITEIGGTVGDIESQPYIEAIRQLQLEVGKSNSLSIHVTLVPSLKGSSEFKSKPTQHSVRDLRSLGINPDIIVARVDEPMPTEIKQKISLFCNVAEDCVIENLTVSNIYEMPLMLEAQNFSSVVLRRLQMETKPLDNSAWIAMITRIKAREGRIKVAIAGKYANYKEANLSVIEALNHASFELGKYVDIKWIEAINEDNVNELLGDVDGIVIPDGFGTKTFEGLLLATKYARENNVPYFGISLGMDTAVVEFARNILGIKNAHVRKLEEGKHYKAAEAHQYEYIVDTIPQNKAQQKSGTMRIGTYPFTLEKSSKICSIYGNQKQVDERHIQKYGLLASNRKKFEKAGLIFSGISEDGLLVESVEIPKNDFFVGVQFRPEFRSRPNRPHPLFTAFLRSVDKFAEKRK